MDVLTDVLRAMRLSGGVFLDAEFTAPWSIISKVVPEDCRPFMAEPAQLIAYHYVVEGCLLLSLSGQAPVSATAGQLLVLPRNDQHLLGSALDLQPANVDELIEPAGDEEPARIRFGGGGARAGILCGFLGSDDRNSSLISSLPAVMKLDLNNKLTGPWIEGSMRYAGRELAVGGPGASANLDRLAELLFTEAIREYVKTLPPGQGGWLGGLRDPFIGQALALVHGQLAHPWTLDELARQVGLSRSTLSDRFARYIGVSPMRYLSHRRLLLAAERLRDGQQSVAEIGYEVGYESEAAFNRAFKREFVMAPGAFRKEALKP
ncbi:AraC family transcriptional regulator [Candidatus Entotheonella serta]|nr:AraC family transcriptional regulator [Candidatus Entotheonella serta]